jgi:hypothetical protein
VDGGGHEIAPPILVGRLASDPGGLADQAISSGSQ